MGKTETACYQSSLYFMHPRKWKSVVERGSLRFKSTEVNGRVRLQLLLLVCGIAQLMFPQLRLALFLIVTRACMLSHFSCVHLFATRSPPGSSVHGILQARLPYPSPGDLPDPGIEPVSPALAGGLYTTEPQRRPLDSHKS